MPSKAKKNDLSLSQYEPEEIFWLTYSIHDNFGANVSRMCFYDIEDYFQAEFFDLNLGNTITLTLQGIPKEWINGISK